MKEDIVAKFFRMLFDFEHFPWRRSKVVPDTEITAVRFDLGCLGLSLGLPLFAVQVDWVQTARIDRLGKIVQHEERRTDHRGRCIACRLPPPCLSFLFCS